MTKIEQLENLIQLQCNVDTRPVAFQIMLNFTEEDLKYYMCLIWTHCMHLPAAKHRISESIELKFYNVEVNRRNLRFELESYWNKYGKNIDEVVDKIIAKYESDQYIDREYKAGRVPTEALYYTILDYARKYGDEVLAQEDFATERHILGNYTITMFRGQGTFVKIEKHGSRL